MSFKSFIINENKFYLGQKVGDVLTALQSLAEDAANLGNRALLRAVQGIVNQIRRILHGRWDDEDVKFLKTMQKIGVALCVGIDAKEDLGTLVASAAQELEAMMGDMKVPANNLGSDQDAGQEPPVEEEDAFSPGSQIGA